RRLAGRQESDRHRELLRRLDAIPDRDRLEADRHPRRGAPAHHRVLSHTLRSVRAGRRRGGDAAHMIGRRVPFLSLVPGEDNADLRAAIDRVLARGWYILGPEVEAFESEFADACGATYAIGVGTGTDAIAITLRALDVGAGDEVVT